MVNLKAKKQSYGIDIIKDDLMINEDKHTYTHIEEKKERRDNKFEMMY